MKATEIYKALTSQEALLVPIKSITKAPSLVETSAMGIDTNVPKKIKTGKFLIGILVFGLTGYAFYEWRQSIKRKKRK